MKWDKKLNVLLILLLVLTLLLVGCKPKDENEVGTSPIEAVESPEIYRDFSNILIDYFNNNNLIVDFIDVESATKYMPINELLKSLNSLLYELEDEGFVFILKLFKGEELVIENDEYEIVELEDNTFIINTKNHNKAIIDTIYNSYK